MDSYYYRYNTVKGIKFIALGLLFMFLDFNIVSDSFYIDILPDAVGLLLILMSIRFLEGYVKNPIGLRVLIFILLLEDIGEWAYTISAGNSGSDVRFVYFLVSLVYAFLYYRILTAMIHVAEDFNSLREKNIRILRTMMIIIQFAIALLSLSSPEDSSEWTLLVVFVGVAVTIANIIVLFGLKKDVENAPALFFAEVEGAEKT